jgi:predicted TIM-barrel fold metal-dependent hydrolase
VDSSLARMPIVDIDSHYTEPRDLWTARAPAKWKDLAPRVVELQGRECWVADRNVLLAPPGLCVIRPDGTKVQGKVSLERFDEMTPAATEVGARLAKLDELGLTLQILYPNVVGFAGAAVMQVKDAALRSYIMSGYNDGVAAMQAESGGRLLPQAVLPFWDAEQSVKELIRCHDELGLTGFALPDAPENWGLPGLHEPHWERLWSVAQERGLPCNFHIGSGGVSMGGAWPNLPFERMLPALSTLLFMANARCIVNLIFSGLLDRFPSQKFVSVESGLGYLPFLLESAEYQLDENGVGGAGLALRPKEYFRRQIYASYWFEREHTRHTIEAVGEDNVMFETDFPHPTCLYPSVRAQVEASLAALPERVQRKVLYQNAARVYGLTLPH